MRALAGRLAGVACQMYCMAMPRGLAMDPAETEALTYLAVYRRHTLHKTGHRQPLISLDAKAPVRRLSGELRAPPAAL